MVDFVAQFEIGGVKIIERNGTLYRNWDYAKGAGEAVGEQAGGGGGRHGSAGQGGRRRGRNAGAAACFHPLGRRWQMKAGGSLSGFCLPVRSVRWMGVGQGSWTVNDYIPPGGVCAAR